MAKNPTLPNEFDDAWSAIRRRGQKSYVGRRNRNERCDVRVVDDLGSRPLPLVQNLRHHSTSFEWGYGGSGPSQLALALLYDYLQDSEKALNMYQTFKRMVVAQLPREGWELPASIIQHALDLIKSGQNTGS